MGGAYQPREQDFVLHLNGVCMSIPASYTRHPFNVMEIRYERDLRSESEQRQTGQCGG